MADFPSEFLSHSRVQPGTNLCKNPNKQILTKPWRIQQRPCSIDQRHIGAMIWKDPLMINGTVWPHLEKVKVQSSRQRFSGRSFPDYVTVDVPRPYDSGNPLYDQTSLLRKKASTMYVSARLMDER
ncbi:hypothetical protein COOONC_07855 [Cooperia oncophora]